MDDLSVTVKFKAYDWLDDWSVTVEFKAYDWWDDRPKPQPKMSVCTPPGDLKRKGRSRQRKYGPEYGCLII